MKQRELECLDKAIYPTPARKRNFKRIACYALFGATMALVPLRAWADSDDPKHGDAINPDPARPSEIVEFTKTGHFVGEYNIHQNEGGAFGVATSISEETSDGGTDIDRLAVVNDNTNDVAVTTFVLP